MTIDLGGLRQGLAVVAAADGDYVIMVRMLPVRCFDDPLNNELNRDKARIGVAGAGAAPLRQAFRGVSRLRRRAKKAGLDGKFYA